MTPKAKLFKFAGYEIHAESQKIFFNYEVEFKNRPALKFSETITLPPGGKLEERYLNQFLIPLSLILGISYYKLFYPPKIKTFCNLSKEEAEFWDIVYRKGLGEFMYVNKLDPKDLAKFPFSKKAKSTPQSIKVLDRGLVGIGGGKDSIVGSLLLKNYETSSFIIETQKEDKISSRVALRIGKRVIKIKRELDPKIFEKYEGSYNGHIPISAVFAFLGLLAAGLYKFKYVIVSNEHSSSFGNLEYKGEIINHQWSKSIEFESLLQEYTRKFITPDITYFSLLRQFYEIRIAKMFAKHGNFFPLFTSCNRSFKIFKERADDLWCGECPKCAFVFLMLSPFLPKAELLTIFKKNLLADPALLPLYRDLLGFGDMKPFDCVGTFEESRAALHLSSRKFTDDIIVTTLLPKIKDGEDLAGKVLQTAPAPTLPTPFKFLGIESVAIVGYAREGKVTEKYLKKNYPHLKIGILDQESDKTYLDKQVEYDLAIKTPGIPMGKMIIPHTTATNIFFSQNKNFTIGITGSKGKSTTASLVYEILKSAGKKVRLLGNIGSPMLESLLVPPDPDEIFVIELSSYMLEDIQYSPNIAVMINLFPEHMNYHGGVENYYKAKNNIFKFQREGDIALRPPFKAKLPFKKSDISLLGKHNLANIKAAVEVARVLRVPEEAIKKTVREFKNLPHRLEYVGEFKGVKFYDDAISTTPESTIAAIEALPKTSTIMLGGEDRGYDFTKLEKLLRQKKIKNIVLFPESGQRILKSKKDFNILETDDMEKAVEFAYNNTKKGGICLLSTASPSYSIWKNFEEKGDSFKFFVNKYAEL